MASGLQGAIDRSFHEVYAKPPRTLGKNQTPTQRRKQMIAIALSKAGASK